MTPIKFIPGFFMNAYIVVYFVK
uniref:Uncharacterized protein n=1 Tax=Anguilla anguilla TaxID=7936 RepID=A0A0E9QCX0_ANGAN